MSLSHVHIGIQDFDRAFAFYSAVLPGLGWRLKFVEPERPWAGWRPTDRERPLILVGRPYNTEPAAPGNGQMVALLAESRRAVDAFYANALTHGAVGDGEPGLRPEYHPHYYSAYVRDPDGNKLCVCCHDP
ncbi:MAG TPA: VOC family protein [Caulobacteraceae bacterium]|jgi:catechol 2,3-dioxygenase-like lactoylglutathione lyase family enzyme|nr:VOC family protein [Caulobacteraceae bacterium]